jgi:ERCC4-related helicase
MDYDDRNLEVPEGTDSLTVYLREGFWPQYIDVFSDFGVSVNFFVDGEALLSYCLDDETLDWSHGGQPVQVAYRFLNFLENLRRRSATRFHVLFFEGAAVCWSGSKLAMRYAIIRHLKTATDISVIDNIDHIFSDEATYEGSFDRLTDVQQPAYLISRRDFNEVTDPEMDPRLITMCEALITRSLNSNQSVVLLDGVSFQGPKIHAWALLERPGDAMTERLLADARGVCEILAVDAKAAGAADAQAPIGTTGRVGVAVRVMKAVLAATTSIPAADRTELARIFLVHAVMLDEIGLRDRAGLLPSALPSAGAFGSVDAFFGLVHQEMAQVLKFASLTPDTVDESICDLWDGRLFNRVLLSLYASQSGELGLTAPGSTTLAGALAEAGLSAVSTPFLKASSADQEACKAVQGTLVAEAESQNDFPQDIANLPSIPSDFLTGVIPKEIMGMYGSIEEIAAPAAVAAVEAPKAVIAAAAAEPAAAEDEGESTDEDWDADSDSEKEESDKEDDGADTAAPATPAAATAAMAATPAAEPATPAAAVKAEAVAFYESVSTWLKAIPLQDGKPIEFEGDAYNTSVSIRSDDVVPQDPDAALNATKKFVGLLRRRLRGRLSVPEAKAAFAEMLVALRATEDLMAIACAKDVESSFSTNEFLGLESLIVRRWQGKLLPQRNDDKLATAIREYAQTLQDSMIQVTPIIEDNDSVVVEKVGLKSAMIQAQSASAKMQEMSSKRQKDYETNVTREVTRALKKNDFAGAWKVLDDFKAKCKTDKLQYDKTEKTIAQLKDRLGVNDVKGKGGKKGGGGGGGKKGKAGKGGKGDDELEEVEKNYTKALAEIKKNNTILVVMKHHLDVSYEWWFERYGKMAVNAVKDLVKLGGGGTLNEVNELEDFLEAERWAAGHVLEELFALKRQVDNSIGEPKYMMDLKVSMASFVHNLGFAAEAKIAILGGGGTEVEVDLAAAKPCIIDRKEQTLTAFQMECMGPLLVRPVGKYDSRISTFRPDDWQQDLLDIVDRTEAYRRECRKAQSKGKSVEEADKVARALEWTDARDTSKLKGTKLTPSSVLVSAPTSSGKTFISFYVMEQVLREPCNGEGIIVYVSPSKALVNQVEADLYARFDKSFEKKSQARSMHGVFLKEFRHGVNDSQILITIPECLEILLFEAQHQKWAHRLRWVIFDEIHCISKENGAVWERLLLATHTPWVALSATIGNPMEFAGWLRTVEESKDQELHLVQVDLRINDLSVNVFDTRAAASDERAMDRVVPLNPLGVLSVQLIKGKGGIPSQTKLLPEHLLEITSKLIQLKAEVNNAEFSAAVDALDYSKRSEAVAVTMEDASSLEQRTKKLIEKLVEVKPDVAQRLIEMIGKRIKAVLTQEDTLLEEHGFQHIEDNLYKCLLALNSAGANADASSDLKRLPAIVFHLTVRGCNRLLNRLVGDLEADQDASEARQFCKIILGQAKCLQGVLMKTGEVSDIVARIMATAVDESTVMDEATRKAVEMSKEVQEFTVADAKRFMEIDGIQANVWTTLDELDDATAAEANKLFAKTVASKRRYYGVLATKCETENKTRLKAYEQASKDDTEQDEEREEYVEPPTYIEFDELLDGYVDRRFSFLPDGQTITDADLKQHLGRRYDASDINSKALTRGIGMHYSEMPRKNKNAVERMFRQRKLKVVIATSTLAMGINMPCKTVIMAGDEPDLSSREYHQMIGRAGRRTFDNRGNVVFIGTPSRKVYRLLSTNVADLVGNVPLTPGLALRLFMRHNGVTLLGSKESAKVRAGYEKHTLAMSERLVRYPFFKMGSTSGKENLQVMHQLLFCTEFLMDPSVGALVKGADGKAVPSPLCSLLLHLSIFEPTNHVLLSLLQSGLLDQLVTDYKVDPMKVLASNVSQDMRDELGLNPKGLDDEIKAQKEALLSVFANIFFLLPQPKRSRTPAADAKTEGKLQPPSAAIASHMATYNEGVLNKFSSFVRRYAKCQGLDGETDLLPGSRAGTAKPSKSPTAATAGSVMADLAATSLATVARSPFVAVSGLGDNFTTVNDLTGSLQEGVYLDKSLVPVVTESSKVNCNPYLTDYFRHSERAPLSRENGLRDAGLYDRLNKFCHAMKVVKVALTKRCSTEDEGEFTRIDGARGAPKKPAAALGTQKGPVRIVKKDVRRAQHPAEKYLVKDRCCEVRTSEQVEEWEEKSGTLARIQIKIIKSDPYNVLLQCPNKVDTPGGRCQHCTRLALVEAITALEQDYLHKFKDVFAFKTKW